VLLTSSGKMQAGTEGRQLPALAWLQDQTGFGSLREPAFKIPRAEAVG